MLMLLKLTGCARVGTTHVIVLDLRATNKSGCKAGETGSKVGCLAMRLDGGFVRVQLGNDVLCGAATNTPQAWSDGDQTVSGAMYVGVVWCGICVLCECVCVCVCVCVC